MFKNVQLFGYPVVCSDRYRNQFALITGTFSGASCDAGELAMNSKCYRKFDVGLTWFGASNKCLFRGGSLAVFADTARLSLNSQLTDWLDRNNTYWIGLVRSWWLTTNKGDVVYCRVHAAVP